MPRASVRRLRRGSAAEGSAASTITTYSPRSSGSAVARSRAARPMIVSNLFVSSRASTTRRSGASSGAELAKQLADAMRCLEQDRGLARRRQARAAAVGAHARRSAGSRRSESRCHRVRRPISLPVRCSAPEPERRVAPRPGRHARSGARVRHARRAGVGDERNALATRAGVRRSPSPAARSLWRCAASNGLAMPKRASSGPVSRVSSAAIASTRPSTHSARSVMSAALPIGSATTYNAPGRQFLFGQSRPRGQVVMPRVVRARTHESFED